MWLVLLLITPCIALRNLEPEPPSPVSNSNIIEDSVDLRLNHFKAPNNETFPMRFYYNGEFAREDVVIFVGGAWQISEGWVRAGLAYDLAEMLHAGLFYTEHRYYGISRPSDNTSTSELRFLSADQALADLAQFIQYIKSDRFNYGIHKYGKVALVGCSYAGSLATWMRLAYPHLVDAAFSDSGPLHAQEDFSEYYEVVTDALRVQGGEECVSNIEQAVEQLVELLATQAGPAQVSQIFNTCSSIQVSAPMDIATFFWFGVTEPFGNLVQYATPGDIPDACSILTDASVASPVQRLANWVTSQPWTQPCIETRYAEVVAAHTNTSYNSPQTAARLWTYQTCVEFGWYRTTTSGRQPFLSTVPLEYFHQMCKDFFSNYFNESVLRAGIERTNLFFAGLSHIPDKVVTVRGGHDPWSPMGPNATHGRHLAPVYVVPQISQCRAIRPFGDSETQELDEVKLAVLLRMQTFITGLENSATAHVISLLTLTISVALCLL